jgi:hypothetical protein
MHGGHTCTCCGPSDTATVGTMRCVDKVISQGSYTRQQPPPGLFHSAFEAAVYRGGHACETRLHLLWS